MKQASTSAIIVMMVFSANMAIFWVKYIRLRCKHELLMAIAYTILVSALSGGYIYNLIESSAIL